MQINFLALPFLKYFVTTFLEKIIFKKVIMYEYLMLICIFKLLKFQIIKSYLMQL